MLRNLFERLQPNPTPEFTAEKDPGVAKSPTGMTSQNEKEI